MEYLRCGASPRARGRQGDRMGHRGAARGVPAPRRPHGQDGRGSLGAADRAGGTLGGRRLEQPRGCSVFRFGWFLSIEDISSCWGSWGLDLFFVKLSLWRGRWKCSFLVSSFLCGINATQFAGSEPVCTAEVSYV